MTRARVSAIVLAAGQGTRMRSRLPKPAHRLCGRPMVSYVLDALADVNVEKAVVVVGHGAERVRESVLRHAPEAMDVVFAVQERQLGTGDAAAVGLDAFTSVELDDEEAVLVVMPGDTPLIRPATIVSLVEAHNREKAGATLLTAHLEDPTGYGRVIRGRGGRVDRVVEQADATEEEKAIDEVNTSIYCFRRSLLAPALRRVTPANAQGEYYLTDVVGVLRDAGYPIAAVPADDPGETVGVNDRLQLAATEAALRSRTNRAWLRSGVTLVDPANTYIDTTVSIGEDVTVYPGSILRGATVVGSGAVIGPDTSLTDCVVGPGARVERSTCTGAAIDAGARVGPYCHLEPGARIGEGTVTGPFYAVPARDTGTPERSASD
ncbi:MAG TPA: bifunctional N-acetylglucosamine-1-phosphate uridyltransferase/glucosamine-1-phosphate acetyltransferase [Acidimicrobiales bacterium]|nr:bifunctional N-acetylglucosamine-1-phosphate uridyltransferase/glucosamine-1-phosphate acetyltransferase [Acidimicrobiales bacterium]